MTNITKVLQNSKLHSLWIMLWIMIEMPSHGRNGESHVTFYQIWEKNETDAADSNVCCQYGMLICNTVCRKESFK